MLACCLAQFGDECCLDVEECGVVTRADVEVELVGHDSSTLDIDGAIVIHLAHETATEFDRTDAALTRTRKHTLDHTLYTVLERLQSHVEWTQ